MSGEENRKIFSENLKYYVDKSGKSVSEIATTLDIPVTTFFDWMKAKTYPRIDKIEMLTEYFGITKSDLIERQNRTTTQGLSMDSRDTFVNNLRFYMAKDNKTRREVSEALGVSYFTFTTWCNGTKYPRIEKIEALADYFGISVSELVGGGRAEQKQIENPKSINSVNVKSPIGNRIRERRKSVNMSVEELAERIGKDRATVYRYENGQIENMPVGLLYPIAEALDVQVEYLIGAEQTDKKKTQTKDDVLGLVIRLHTDPDFLEIVKRMSLLDEEKLNALKMFLDAFGE